MHLLFQVVNPGEDPDPNLWKKVDVTDQIGGTNSTFRTGAGANVPFSGCQLSSASTTFYLTNVLKAAQQHINLTII